MGSARGCRKSRAQFPTPSRRYRRRPRSARSRTWRGSPACRRGSRAAEVFAGRKRKGRAPPRTPGSAGERPGEPSFFETDEREAAKARTIPARKERAARQINNTEPALLSQARLLSPRPRRSLETRSGRLWGLVPRPQLGGARARAPRDPSLLPRPQLGIEIPCAAEARSFLGLALRRREGRDRFYSSAFR